MWTKIGLIIIICFLAAITSQYISAIDAPHEPHDGTNVCTNCHADALVGGLLKSPFWGGTDESAYDLICTSCHTDQSCGTEYAKGPKVETHSYLTADPDPLHPKYGTWAIQCRTCHDPHYQRQKNYKSSDPNDYYLATGMITGCVYYDPEDYEKTYFDPNLISTTILTYDPSKLKHRAGWEDLTLLTHKTGDCRRAILFPNVNRLGYNYPVIAIDETETAKTITVKGDATQYLYPPTSFAVIYGQYIKDSIYVQNQDGSGTYKTVRLFDKIGQNSFAFNENGTGGDPTPNGICQVCHADQTNPLHLKPSHWSADGTGADHYNNNVYEEGCIHCHPHTGGFIHGGGGGTECIECHGHDEGYEYESGKYSKGNGTSQSHSTHTENDSDDLKGPNIRPDIVGCGSCHDTSNLPYFKSGVDGNGDGKYNLSETDVCDPCHSPGGAYDGVNDSVIGAKKNWCQGVYEGNILRTGKENWCLGCHDDAPASIKLVLAPNVAGDNVNYGYNATGHGIYGNPSITCLGSQSQFGCHNALIRHTDGNTQTYASASNNYKSGYRLAEGMAIPRNGQYGASAFKLCFKCHDSTPFLTETNSETDFRDDTKIDPESGVAPWNFHWEHLKESYSGGKLYWDSDNDWPGGECIWYTDCCDSTISCTTCHNVHGSPCIVGTSIVSCTNPVSNPMIRHGELISTPTKDRTPAFQFHWYDENNNEVTDFKSSKKGGLRVGEPYVIDYNHVCWGCHPRGERQYTREPRVNILLIDESFEGPGYEEFETGIIGSGCSLSPDAALPTPLTGAGSECLQVTADAGKQAYAKRDYGSEQNKTITSFYLYVETENLVDPSNKNIGILDDNSGTNVFVFRLNKNGTQLRFNLRIYNDGWKDNYYDISTGVWYKIDVKYDATNNKTWAWRVDGIPQPCVGGCTLGDVYFTGIRTWNFGFMGTGTSITGTIYYDLIKVNTISYE